MKQLIIALFTFILVPVALSAQGKKDFIAQAADAVTIYNPKANAKADIDAAVAKAKKEGKHVFIQIGGNWSNPSVAFHKLVEETPELKTYLNTNYETVLVNYSPENKNTAIMASLDYPGRFGYPVFVILDGQGKLLHTQDSSYLEEGKGHDLKKVMKFLQGWTAAALKPENKAK